MRIITAHIIVFVLVLQGLAGGAVIKNFDNESPEAIVILGPPYDISTIKVEIPYPCQVLEASLNISSVEDNQYPTDVQLLLNNTLLWQFSGLDFGSLGMQDGFQNTTIKWNTTFGPKGGTNGTKILLPKNATVESASIDISYTGPGAVLETMNYLGETGEDLGPVSDTGDINGDGYDDFLAGAPDCEDVGYKAGAVYVYFGGLHFPTTPNITLYPPGERHMFGSSVSGAGDVNGDGFDDIIIGAAYNNTGTGSAFLFYGGANMDVAPDVVFHGNGTLEDFGRCVSGAGDVNGDGFGDVIIGSDFNTLTFGISNRAFIYYGGKNMDNVSDVTVISLDYMDKFGHSVCGVGDVNSDGYDDVLVGAPWDDSNGLSSGRMFLYLGGSSMDNVADLIVKGKAAGDQYGLQVSGAGDLNGDGYADFMATGIAGNISGSASGRVDIFFGGNTPDSTPDLVLYGAKDGEDYGADISGAGDINADGYGDIIVGSPGNDSAGNNYGMAMIYLGGAIPDANPDFYVAGSKENASLGGFASGAGDVDSDGYSEMLLNASRDAGYGFWDGRVLLEEFYPGVLDPAIQVGADIIYNVSGYYSGGNHSNDLAQVMNKYLVTATVAFNDSYGNRFAYLDVNVKAKSNGTISLSNLTINYNYSIRTFDFTDPLNNYLRSHSTEKNTKGNISVPFIVKSSKDGNVKLSDLKIVVDEPPKLEQPIPDLAIDEDSSNLTVVDLYQYFKDDYDITSDLHYNIVSVSNNSTVGVELTSNRFVSIDAESGPQNDNWTGVVELLVNATDRWGFAAMSNPFKIIIRNIPDPPVLTSIPSEHDVSGEEYRYQATSEDGDGDVLVYDLPDHPLNMTVDKNSGLVRWVPDRGGVFSVSLTVEDGIFKIFQNFTITVPNRPPKEYNSTPPAGWVWVPYSWVIPIIDNDKDALTFWLVECPEGMNINRSTGTIDWTPQSPGNFSVKATVSDGRAQIDYSFSIIIIQPNRNPEFTNSKSGSTLVDTAYTIQITATDPDGDSLTFSIVQSPSGVLLDSKTGRLNWTPVAAGNYTVRLKASDGRGGETVQDMNITVTPAIVPRISLKTPTWNETVKGLYNVSGIVTKGTREVKRVQIRFDDNDWITANGTYKWYVQMDTKKYPNGIHTLELQAFDGKEYSEFLSGKITINNPVPAKEKKTPMMDGYSWFALGIILAFVLEITRKREQKYV